MCYSATNAIPLIPLELSAKRKQSTSKVAPYMCLLSDWSQCAPVSHCICHSVLVCRIYSVFSDLRAIVGLCTTLFCGDGAR